MKTIKLDDTQIQRIWNAIRIAEGEGLWGGRNVDEQKEYDHIKQILESNLKQKQPS